MAKLNFMVMLRDVEGYMNVRSERLVQQERECLYPVEFQRGSPSIASQLHSSSWCTDASAMDGNILSNLIGKKAKNQLDIVFACRALFPQTFGQIKVDYERELNSLLREVTVRIIPGLRKLGDLLDLVGQCPAVPRAPSWTLNLTCGKHLHPATPYFGLWVTTRLISSNTARISSDEKTLQVQGVIVDHVSIVSDEFPHYTLRDQARWHEEVHAVLIEWRARTSKLPKDGFEEGLVAVLYAATNSMEQTAEIFSQHSRLERVRFDSTSKLFDPGV